MQTLSSGVGSSSWIEPGPLHWEHRLPGPWEKSHGCLLLLFFKESIFERYTPKHKPMNKIWCLERASKYKGKQWVLETWSRTGCSVAGVRGGGACLAHRRIHYILPFSCISLKFSAIKKCYQNQLLTAGASPPHIPLVHSSGAPVWWRCHSGYLWFPNLPLNRLNEGERSDRTSFPLSHGFSSSVKMCCNKYLLWQT